MTVFCFKFFSVFLKDNVYCVYEQSSLVSSVFTKEDPMSMLPLANVMSMFSQETVFAILKSVWGHLSQVFKHSESLLYFPFHSFVCFQKRKHGSNR